jgi:hypothetical protein
MEKLGKIAAHHVFDYKVTAVHLQITTCFSAVDFFYYVGYILHFLALSVSAVNHATALHHCLSCDSSIVDVLALST